jgi:vacuolar protein-sorting-associated protein 4
MLTPCQSFDHGAMPMRLNQVPPEKLLEPPLTSEDFLGVIAKTRPSVAGDELGKYTKWTEDFGSEGA